MDDDGTQPWTPQEGTPTGRTWTCSLGGRAYELDVVRGVTTRLVLRVDGEVVHDETSSSERRSIVAGPGRRVVVRLSSMGAVRRATAHDGRRDLDFDAPPGSRTERTQQWGRAHPMLFALRHVAIKGGIVLVAVLGLSALLRAVVQPVVRWIAERTPHVDLPDVELPEIPWPQISWPQISLPDWLVALLAWLGQYDHIVNPLLIGLVLALVEFRRQRRQRRMRDSGAVDDPVVTPDRG